MSAIRKEKPRFEKIEGGKSDVGNGTKGDGSYQLHLVFDRVSHAKLVALKGQLRAATFGEVFRRAIEAYEIFDPDDLNAKAIQTEEANSPKSKPTRGDVKHVNVRIPAWMKEFLDREKLEHGRNHSETIRQSLRVLTQLVRKREQLLMKLNEENNEHKQPDKIEPTDDAGITDDEAIMMITLA